MDDSRALILKVLSKQKSDLITLSSKMDKEVNIKSEEASEAHRKYGNKLYLQNDHDDKPYREIFAHYCKSIITAPIRSEQLILALANRSALLLDMGKYQDCILDVDKALNIIANSNILLKVKLLCRKAECLKKLGLLVHSSDVLNEAENYTIAIDEKSKCTCEKLINRVKRISVCNKSASVDKNMSLPVTREVLDHISIDCNERYGRHLIATKDYLPGDIIFVEKLYATIVHPENSCLLCNYCLKYAWSGVPCEQCDWAIFCCEECREKALTEFHDVECKLISHLKLLDELLFPYYNISLRLLILGIREVGSIAKLKEALKSVDNYQDNCYRGFHTNGRFDSKTIQSVYSLYYDELSDSECENLAFAVALILSGIFKYSNLIDDSSIKEIDDLVKSKDALFLGSLLIKLIKIKSSNAFCINENEDSKKSKCQAEYMKQPYFTRGSGFSTLASLMNHSCFHNAKTCFTEDLKTVVYALQPIKKNSQIFISYSASFYFFPLHERQAMLKKYNFDCNCEACQECWPPLSIMTTEELVQQNYLWKSSIEQKIYFDCLIDVFTAIKSRSTLDKNVMEKISKNLIQARALEQPSLITSMLMEAMHATFTSIYGMKSPSFAKFKV